MKKVISSLVLSFMLMGSFAQAQTQEGTVAIGSDGTIVLQPLSGYCPPQPTAEDLQVLGACEPSNSSECPAHYEETAKYCWGGWGRGFYRCGSVCKPYRDHEGRGGDRGGKGGRGGHGHGGHGGHGGGHDRGDN
ncbi:hypothetical protein ACNQKP_13980 [Bdellovibrio bacteriovorus]|uniref:hypothetical protein n=1 Tax=Bdellovibrio bacteriovorus TaxID=959 RepID=UPI003AA80776